MYFIKDIESGEFWGENGWTLNRNEILYFVSVGSAQRIIDHFKNYRTLVRVTW